MSRIGKMPIVVPAGVEVELSNGCVSVVGRLGTMRLALHSCVAVLSSGDVLNVTVNGVGKVERSLHGLYRSLVNNAVIGVHSGFEKRLELNGVGYQVQIKGGQLELSVGYSKPVVFQVPKGINVAVLDSTHMVISGVDKHCVGQFAAQVRSARVPDPYKAKGVKYVGEFIRRKAGKAFGAGAK